MSIAHDFAEASARYHVAAQAFDEAVLKAIPNDHPLRVELREASKVLDDIVTDRDIVDVPECGT